MARDGSPCSPNNSATSTTSTSPERYRSVGFRRRSGLFLFRREATGPDSWGRSGGFCANVLHCADAVGVEDAMALLRSDVWLDLPIAVDAGPDLPRVHPVEPPPLPTSHPLHLPDFLQAALRFVRRPATDPALHGMDRRTRHHRSRGRRTSGGTISPPRVLHLRERPTADADRFGICGATERSAANRTRCSLIPVGQQHRMASCRGLGHSPWRVDPAL